MAVNYRSGGIMSDLNAIALFLTGVSCGIMFCVVIEKLWKK